MINGAEHVFMYVLAIWMSSLEKCLFNSFTLLIGLLSVYLFEKHEFLCQILQCWNLNFLLLAL